MDGTTKMMFTKVQMVRYGPKLKQIALSDLVKDFIIQ